MWRHLRIIPLLSIFLRFKDTARDVSSISTSQNKRALSSRSGITNKNCDSKSSLTVNCPTLCRTLGPTLVLPIWLLWPSTWLQFPRRRNNKLLDPVFFRDQLLGLVRIKLYFTKVMNLLRPCWAGYQIKNFAAGILIAYCHCKPASRVSKTVGNLSNCSVVQTVREA